MYKSTGELTVSLNKNKKIEIISVNRNNQTKRRVYKKENKISTNKLWKR